MRVVQLTVLLVMLSGQALALGITPASKILDFEPGQEKVIVYRIYNTEQKDFIAELNITGGLKDYITLDQSRISFTKEDKVKSFTLTIRIPDDAPKDASATIAVVGVPKDASATLRLQASLGLNMPTGAVVSEQADGLANEDTSPLLAIAGGILVLLIIGNVVYFTYARWPAKNAPTPGIRIDEPQMSGPADDVKDPQASEPALQPGPAQMMDLAADAPASAVQPEQVEPTQFEPHVQSLQEPTPQSIMESLNERICFADGSPVSSVSEMIYFLENIDEATYSSYVNSRKNDIAVWTDLVLKEPRLAMRIYDAGSKYEVMNAFNVHMIGIRHKEEERRHAAELKEEIDKLRSELGF